MKKFVTNTVLCATILQSCTFTTDGIFPFSKPIEGKGVIKNKIYEGEYDKIKIAQTLDVEIEKSDIEKVVVTAPSDLLPYIIIENQGDELYIHLKKNVSISTRNVAIKIFAKDFSSLSASSSASIFVRDRFTQDHIDVKVSSSGSIEGELEANNLSIEASSSGNFRGKIWAVNLTSEVTSSGDVSVSGKTKNANLSASSSGTLNASNVTAANATLHASSSGDIRIAVSNQLQADASSSGDIIVYKKGSLNTISKNESSSGSVTIK